VFINNDALINNVNLNTINLHFLHQEYDVFITNDVLSNNVNLNTVNLYFLHQRIFDVIFKNIFYISL